MKDHLCYQFKTDGTEVVKIFILGHRTTGPLLLIPFQVLHPTPPPLLSSLHKVGINLILMQLKYETNLFQSAPLHNWLFPTSPLLGHSFSSPLSPFLRLNLTHMLR